MIWKLFGRIYTLLELNSSPCGHKIRSGVVSLCDKKGWINSGTFYALWVTSRSSSLFFHYWSFDIIIFIFELHKDYSDEEEDDDDWTDDEDMSWKVRRASAKCFDAFIVSSITNKYLESVGSLLIQRTREREESVLIEVLLSLRNLIKRLGRHQALSQLDQAMGWNFLVQRFMIIKTKSLVKVMKISTLK